ncbi:MAG TPA: thiamine diphosphokinase [Candidatus Egerieousia sp.]|nr:thiamine diphosphokinase [Candidatus Egerieousia sp.]HPT05124.1 thiamine diphosphokinase [Candidatus Egerieousia sp.]
MKRKNIIIVCDGDFPTAKLPLKILQDAAGKCNGIIIACDGTAVNLAKRGFTPDYIVGDMDTLSASYQKKYKPLIHKNTSQENNDQTKAFEFALKLIKEAEKAATAKSVASKPETPNNSLQTQYKIVILGATGKREDHTLGNISLLADYEEMLMQFGKKEFTRKASAGNTKLAIQEHDSYNITVEIITDYGIFTPYLDSFKISAHSGEQISFFAFDPTLHIKSKGLMYPLDNVKFDMWWKATLNEFAPSNGSRVTAGNGKATAELKFNHPAKVLVFRKF